MNIIEFIEARIAEDEAAARNARPGPWIDTRDTGTRIGPEIGDGYLMVPELELAPCEDYIPNADTTHIARHDPARALRQCKSIRTTIKHLEDLSDTIHMPWYVSPKAEAALEAIAAIWSDHPDYEQEWTA